MGKQPNGTRQKNEDTGGQATRCHPTETTARVDKPPDATRQRMPTGGEEPKIDIEMG